MGQIKNIKLHIVTDIKSANENNHNNMISSRGASLLLRAASRTTTRCSVQGVQPRRLLAVSSQARTTAADAPAAERCADQNDHAWALEGGNQPELDESLPFQTENKNQLLLWLAFWTFLGLSLPWMQVPFFDYGEDEEE